MICADITKLIKRFQDDLLVDAEYQEFVAHVNRCPSCREYVFSLGALSTQLWALGQVDAPEDLASSVIFRLRHRPPPPPARWSLQHLRWEDMCRESLLMVFVIVVMVGVYYLFIQNFNRQDSAATKSAISLETDVTPPEETETRPFASDRQTPREDPREPAHQPAGVVEVYTNNVIYSFSGENKQTSISAAAKSLHWHILLSSDAAVNAAWKKITAFVDQEQQKTAELKEVEEAIRNAPKEDIREEETDSFRQHYSLPSPTVTQPVFQKLRDSEVKMTRKAQLEKEIQRLGQDKEQARRAWQEQVLKKKHEGAENKARLLGVLRDAGVRPDYDRHNMLIFTATGDALDVVLEQILILDDERGSFLDLSRDKVGNRYRVYLYLGQEETPGVHWDIDNASRDKKDKILEAVKAIGGAGEYTSEECLVFYGAVDKIKELRIKIQSMRVDLVETGTLQAGEKMWESKPVAVSMCFLN